MTKLWEPPKLQSEKLGTQERHATWLELFYDLAYVATIAILAERLHHDLSLFGIAEFLILFVPIWHLWLGATVYADRFDTDDLIHPLLTFIQMIGIGGLAVFGHRGIIDGFTGIILSYAIVKGSLIVMNLHAGSNNKAAWELTNRYALGFSIGLGLCMLSLILPSPLHFWIAGAGFLVNYLTPFTISGHDMDVPVHTSHLPERFGLFSIIVLGEMVAGIISASLGHSLNGLDYTIATCGLILTFCIWWMYFQNINAQSLLKNAYHSGKKDIWRWRRSEYRHSVLFVQSHLPLSIALVITAVGIENMILPHSYRDQLLSMLMIIGGVNVTLVCIGLMEWITYDQKKHALDRLRVWLRAICAGSIALLTTIGMIHRPYVFFSIITALFVGQVVAEVWYRYRTDEVIKGVEQI